MLAVRRARPIAWCAAVCPRWDRRASRGRSTLPSGPSRAPRAPARRLCLVAMEGPRNYDRMLETLSDLIRFKNKADALTWRDAFENMDVYLDRVGILGDLDKLSIIHVAGTKGKGSTCAMVESMLRGCGYRTGLYTSPHLIDVRERVRIDGQMVDKAEFERQFWWCYERLLSAATPEVGVPGYFRFMTLLALKMFLVQKVDVVLLEVGLGGRLDATNCVRKPEVTAITSLGMDHMETLGDTIAKIAREKAGIMKEGRPAFTVAQPDDAMAVLKEVASTVGAPLTIVPPLPAAQVPGVAARGAHMLTNAGLAVQLAHQWERNAPAAKSNPGAAARLAELASGQLPEAYVRGMEDVQWAGRSQVVSDEPPSGGEGGCEGGEGGGGRLVFYIDGAHTPESMATCADWFAQQASACKTDPADVRRVLLFNCMRERDPDILLPALARGLEARGLYFQHGLFVPSDSFYGFLPSKAHPTMPAAGLGGGGSNGAASHEPDLSWQLSMQAVWDGHKLGRATAAAAAAHPPPLPTGGLACLRAEVLPGGGAVLPSISSALEWLRAYTRAAPRAQVQVLVTGSLYMVGDILRLLGKAPK